MDLGIAGRTAIVCASSHGLGRASAMALAKAGCTLVVNGRDAEDGAATAAAIRTETGATVTFVPGDLGDADVRAALVEAAGGVVDILVNNNGGPPARDFHQLDGAAIHAGVEANMVVPIDMVRRTVDGMAARGWGRILCITSASVKQPLAGLDLSSGARIGLTGFLAGVARQMAGSGVTINFLLPGAFATRRIDTLNRAAAEAAGITPDEALERRRRAIPAGRLGEPDEFGATCAFLCSDRAGYITGQSILIDGGAYPGVL